MPSERAEIQRNCRETGDYRLYCENGLNGLVRDGWEFSHAPETLLKRLDDPASHICKDRPKVKAVLAGGYFLKRYHTLGFFNALRRAFRPPRPERVLAAAVRLRRAGIPTPEVFAALRRSRFGIPRCDYLVTEALPPQSCDGLNITDDTCILNGATTLMVQMHQAGVEHGDLNLRNIFCRKTPDGGYADWGVIDLDGCRLYPTSVPQKRRRRELARLVSSLLRAKPELKTRSGEVLEAFAEKYRELSGRDLRGEALEKRTVYLTERIRKDQRK